MPDRRRFLWLTQRDLSELSGVTLRGITILEIREWSRESDVESVIACSRGSGAAGGTDGEAERYAGLTVCAGRGRTVWGFLPAR